MTTKPTDNDVLSGRGAWFNQHPGNGHFRRMLDEHKAQYIKGTKKQKMNMSNAIVESIYSMEPRGRFLKQCPDTGQWSELSKREAADRVAQAMAYAVRGKEKSKRRKERRRLSQRSLPSPRDIVMDSASSQPVDRPTNNHVEGVVPRSSSVARHGLAARVSTTAAAAAAAGTNNAESAVSDDHTDLAANELLLSDNSSNIQQQLLIQQLLQSSSSSTTLPPASSVAALNVNQNGLVQLLAQALQHHQQQRDQHHQQQLPLQYALGHDSLGLSPTQAPLQPASLEGLNQILAQTQQQQQLQQQLLLQQQIVIQRLLNQQNALPSASLPPLPTLSVSVPSLSQGTLLPDDFLRGKSSNYSTGSQSQLATNNAIQNQVQPQSHPSNAHLLSMLSTLQNQPNIGLFNAPQQAQQLDDQLQRSLVRQQQQLLASSLVASNQPLLQQPPQSLSLELLCQAWQTALRRQNENSQRSPSINALLSANAAAPSCMKEESKDEEQSGSEDDRA